MRLSTSARSIVALVALAAAACQAPASDNSAGAASAEEVANNTGALTVKHLTFVDTQDAPKDSLNEFRPDFTTCSTTVNYLQVEGLAQDIQAKINAKLKEGAVAPTCDSPQETETTANVHFLDSKTKNVLSVSENTYWDGGGAHPDFGTSYKNFDLTTGELITLDAFLTPAALTTIHRSVSGTIGSLYSAKRIARWEKDADGRLIPGKKRTTALTADEIAELKDNSVTLLSAVKDVFTKFDSATNKSGKASLGDIQDFAIGGTGIEIDVVNYLPHAVKALAEPYGVKYSTLKASKATSPLADRLFGK